jgi:hypothetical protein
VGYVLDVQPRAVSAFLLFPDLLAQFHRMGAAVKPWGRSEPSLVCTRTQYKMFSPSVSFNKDFMVGAQLEYTHQGRSAFRAR